MDPSQRWRTFNKVRGSLRGYWRIRILKGSKRYTRFLRFIVEEALSGNSGGIKERSLGIAVFDRPLDYDTYSDSIVRVAASEVRKRIAQYYDSPGHDHELRIGLPSGSYTPEFRLGRHHASGATTVHADNGLRTLKSGLASGTEDVSEKSESQVGRLLQSPNLDLPADSGRGLCWRRTFGAGRASHAHGNRCPFRSMGTSG